VDKDTVKSLLPKDLTAFNSKFVDEVYEGKYEMQSA
jgi:hypothetical protein